MPRRAVILGGVSAAVILIAGVTWVLWPDHPSSSRSKAAGKPTSASSRPGASAPPVSYPPGTAIPAAALQTTQLLVSTNAGQQRSALAPELAATATASGGLFPAGSTLTMAKNSWHASGAYADAYGTLTEPGKPPVEVVLGFAQQSTGAWLVTFEEAAA